jgi:lysophospholipase L1-like esterase
MLDMMKHFTRPIAILAIAALTACGGGTGPTVQPPTNSSPAPVGLTTTGVALVGVGDSLTAGYQSSGFLGVPSVSVSPGPVSAYPGNAVYPGQDSGFWAILNDCVNSTGATCNHTSFSTTNVSLASLPLIKAPGLADQLILTASGLAPVQSACSSFNTQAYSSSGWAATRVNPAASVTDLGVPGITMHEAIAMYAPLTGPSNAANCGYLTLPGDPTSGGLQSLVTGESELFYPVLGGYLTNFHGNSLTELNVAVALKPKLATVWLGANDLLKYIFSNGQSPISDTPTQMATDLTQIVASLKASGAKVLVADLPNVLTTAQFFPQAKLNADLQSLGVPAAAAGAIVSYVGTTYGVTAGGYLTESGFLSIVQNCSLNPATCVTPPLDPSGAGSGAGGAYITPAFAAQINAANTAYNTAIDSVATGSGTGVALVPITATFTSIAGTGVPLGPGMTATLQFGGGLLSWDGLHPSNLGYAIIANAFIQAADSPSPTGLGLTIPPLSNAQIGGIAQTDPYDPFVIKTIDPGSPFPLP